MLRFTVYRKLSVWCHVRWHTFPHELRFLVVTPIFHLASSGSMPLGCESLDELEEIRRPFRRFRTAGRERETCKLQFCTLAGR